MIFCEFHNLQFILSCEVFDLLPFSNFKKLILGKKTMFWWRNRRHGRGVGGTRQGVVCWRKSPNWRRRQHPRVHDRRFRCKVPHRCDATAVPRFLSLLSSLPFFEQNQHEPTSPWVLCRALCCSLHRRDFAVFPCSSLLRFFTVEMTSRTSTPVPLPSPLLDSSTISGHGPPFRSSDATPALSHGLFELLASPLQMRVLLHAL